MGCSVCQGSVLQVGDVTLFGGPANAKERIDISVMMSMDGGVSILSTQLVHSGPTLGYSDLVLFCRHDEILLEKGSSFRTDSLKANSGACTPGILYENGEPSILFRKLAIYGVPH